jgi:hypothetical protein
MTDMTDNDNQLSPSGSMTNEQFRADRKAAGRAIDVATCQIYWFLGWSADPYGIGENPITDADLEVYQINWFKGCECFVRSPESGGYVWAYDLPKEKRKALRDRIAVEDALYSAARPKRGAVIDDQTMVVERFRRMFPEEAREFEAAVREVEQETVYWRFKGVFPERAREIEKAVCEEVIERFRQMFPERAREIDAAVREEEWWILVIDRFRRMFPERAREIEASVRKDEQTKLFDRFRRMFPERACEIEAAVREEVIERFKQMFPERAREIEAREKAAVLPYYSYWVRPQGD